MSTTVTRTAERISEKSIFIRLNEFEAGDNHINCFDSYKRNNDPTKSVDDQVALENCQRADGFIHHSAKCQRD